jgi:hypothetical protein
MKRERWYQRKAMELGALLRPGEIAQLIVRHEHWCPLLTRGGTCTCAPDIELVRAEREA